MPKNSTLEIQNEILKLGERLGFISRIEEKFHSNISYAPIYDAVWYLDLTKYFNVSALEKLFVNAPYMFERIKLLPIAGFEIEGASTSSKNQLGNFGNLYSGHFLYNFVIVNNSASNGENDTYRRGRKLYKYFYEEYEAKNTFFVDYVHLKNSIANLGNLKTDITISTNYTPERKSFGGDITSISLYNKIFPFLANSNLDIKQNYSPIIPKIKFKRMADAFNCIDSEIAGFLLGKYYHNTPSEHTFKVANKPSDTYYIPKLDVVAGFIMPNGFYEWLYQVSVALGSDYVNFPILYGIREKILKELFIPLVSIEFENSINKHCNGGIINMSHYSYFGILMGNESAKTHIDFLKENMGINNVTFLTMEDL